MERKSTNIFRKKLKEETEIKMQISKAMMKEMENFTKKIEELSDKIQDEKELY